VSRRAVRALPFLAAVCCAVLLILAVVSAGAATAGREVVAAPAAAAPDAAAPAAEAVPAVFPPAAGAALCSADLVGRTAADFIPLPPRKKCDTGKYCAVPQDCQCMGYPCACVSNKCICAYP